METYPRGVLFLQDRWIDFIKAHALPWSPSTSRFGEPHAAIRDGIAAESRGPPKTSAGLQLARRPYCDRDTLRQELVSACLRAP